MDSSLEATVSTVLLADDEANLRTLVRATLEHPARRIFEAADGSKALDIARRERPDLVVLDHMMPGMSGLDVLRALRSEPATRPIPIVMLTASSQDRDKLQAEQLGVDAYLVKPFSPLELLQTVEQLVGRAPRADTATPETPALDTENGGIDALLQLPASQLARYTHDLRQAVEAERARAAELSEANERLKILDQLKTEFLSFISHELRTPLNHMAAVDIFDPDADRRDQLETIDMIRQGYERLESFVLRGLDYFNWLGAERGDLDQATYLTQLVARVIGELPALHAPGVTCRADLPPDACWVRGCADDLAELVHVLLDNALKFSPGEKLVRVAVERTAGRIRVRVADRGTGFAPEMAREIFRPFTIADGMHHSAGTGLGLALASAIVAAHGGEIRGESPGAGGGATFIVDLPELLDTTAASSAA